MYCSKCGKELRQGENFCSKCGTPVANNSNSTVENNFKSKLQGFWNKAKDAYKNAIPKTPTLEIMFNEQVEKQLLDMGFQWFYSNIDGEKLRLYKYYVGSAGKSISRIEIETFDNNFSDIYVCQNIFGDYTEILAKIMYDLVKLRDNVYIRYVGEEQRIKLAELPEIANIVDNTSSENEFIEPNIEIMLNNKMINELEQGGYTKNYSYNNDGSCSLKLEKGHFTICLYVKNKNELDLNNNILAPLTIAEHKALNMNYYNNKLIENMLHLLKMNNVFILNGYAENTKRSLLEFLGNTNLSFQTDIDLEDYEDDDGDSIADIKTNNKRAKRT